MMDKTSPSWAEIDLTAIKYNLCNIRKAARGSRVMAVVKADAYGHGMLEVSRACMEEGIDYLGVASLNEALQLLDTAGDIPVLVLGYLPKMHAQLVVEKGIRATVYDYNLAQELSRAALEIGRSAYVHIKVDTGMGRLGFCPGEESLKLIRSIADLPGIKLEGIFTHFAVSDIEDKGFTLEQLDLFSSMIASLEEAGIIIPLKHCSNSAALMEMPETHFNMVRAGIVLYGLYPSKYVKREKLDIIPAMTLKSRVGMVKTLEAGHTVSYGRTYCCEKEILVATVPIGYAEGYSRLLSNRAHAVIKGQRVPLIGIVCMDQCMFDVSGLKRVSKEDEVVLFGKPEDGVTADELAEIIGTINYEIVCSVSSRVPRIYKG